MREILIGLTVSNFFPLFSEFGPLILQTKFLLQENRDKS